MKIADKNASSSIDFLLYCIIVISFLSGVILRIINRHNFRNLNGDLDSTLTLEFESIAVNNKIYQLSQIKKLEFKCYDYKGYSTWPPGFRDPNLNNALSQGVENTITIELADGSKMVYNFQQLYQNEINRARPELINYYTSGKLHFLNLVDTLGIRTYEDIQIFKFTLPPTLH